MDIRGANTTALDSDVNVTVLEGLELELLFLEVCPILLTCSLNRSAHGSIRMCELAMLTLDHETCCTFWVRHLCGCVCFSVKCFTINLEVVVKEKRSEERAESARNTSMNRVRVKKLLGDLRLVVTSLFVVQRLFQQTAPEGLG